MHDKKLYGTATVGTKGQIVIPAELREAFGIEPGDRLYALGSLSNKWIGFIPEEQLRAMLEKLTDNIELYKDVLERSETAEE
jgi:bifunctional DNA-binding transcriptional regulator/antitoxin component of YhaV-PrlF toxin-antitoxin module